MDVRSTRAYSYAAWAAQENNRYVPKYVRLQAQKWLEIADGNDADAFISEAMLKKVCKLLKIINHPDLNRPMYDALEDYAVWLVIAVFCTLQRGTGQLYYRTALLEISRKNFKTFTSAVIFIIGMLISPRFSRFFSVAPDLKLSKELQGAIKKIIKSSPLLSDDKIIRVMRNEVRCILTDSEYTPLAYSEDKMDGKLANIFLADEAGAMDSYPVEAMRSSQITLRNKLGIIISTQYPNDNNVLIDEIDKAKKVLLGLHPDKRYFSLLYEPDEEIRGEWQTNDLCIYQSNPVAYSHDYIFDDLKDKRADAVLYENKRQNYLCKHNNIMYKSLGVEGYVDVLRLKECRRPKDDDFWRGRSVFLGVDLSQTSDNTAVAMACCVDGVVYARVFAFIPAAAVETKTKKENVDYKAAIRAGDCFPCGEDIIDYEYVEQFVLGIEERYGVRVLQLGFDRWNALSSVQKFESAENPIECVEIRQHSSVLHPATKLLEEKIMQRQFVYDENMLLEINFQNARCTTDTNLNKYVNKKKSEGKVDMVVALINAMYLLNLDLLEQDKHGWVVQY